MVSSRNSKIAGIGFLIDHEETFIRPPSLCRARRYRGNDWRIDNADDVAIGEKTNAAGNNALADIKATGHFDTVSRTAADSSNFA